MEYKLMEIDSLYDAYIRQFPLCSDLSYEQHYRRVIEDCVFESDYIHKFFHEALRMETMKVYYNYGELQEKWDNNEDKDPFSILLRQIKFFSPNVLYIANIGLFTREQLDAMRAVLQKKIYFVCYHFSFINDKAKAILPYYDLAFTGSNYMLEQMKPYTRRVRVVRHAFEPSILKKIDVANPKNEICFAGSIMIGSAGHTNRLDMLSALTSNHIEYDYYGSVYGSIFRPRSLVDHLIHEPSKLYSRIKTARRLDEIARPSQFGLSYYKCLSEYGLNLNIHAVISGTGAGNLRMFEVTGVGSCLITDYRDENALLFEEGKEIVVYKNTDELVEKVKYLLSHPEVAREIAKKGQERTVREYNYENKAILMNQFIQELF